MIVIILIEFLAITRNLFEPVLPHGYDRWADIDRSDNSLFHYPLESDERAIQFLSDYDYDIDKACFHLFSALNCGKGIDYTEMHYCCHSL